MRQAGDQLSATDFLRSPQRKDKVTESIMKSTESRQSGEPSSRKETNHQNVLQTPPQASAVRKKGEEVASLVFFMSLVMKTNGFSFVYLEKQTNGPALFIPGRFMQIF